MATRKTLYVDANGDYIESTGMFETSDYLITSSGVGDAGKPVLLNSNGQIDASMIAFNGLDWKNGARVASTVNLTLTAPGAAIDGVTLSNGDRVVVKDQINLVENGIYVFNGAAAAMTRSVDADQDIEVTGNLVIAVAEGTTSADQIFKIVTNDPIIVGTTGIQFETVPFNTFSGGDGIDLTNNIFSVDHDGEGFIFVANQLALELDGATLAKSVTGLKVTDGGIDTLQLAVDSVTAAKLNPDTAGLGLVQAVGGELDVNVDATTLEINADTLRVKALGINDTHIDFGTGVNQVSASDLPILDSAGNYNAIDVEAALAEIATKLVDRDVASAGESIAVGDLLYFSANDTVSIYNNISVTQRAVGVALEAATIGNPIAYARYDEVSKGAISGAVAGDRYYWDGTSLTSTIPNASGQFVWQCGIAKNATDLLLTVEFIKKNS